MGIKWMWIAAAAAAAVAFSFIVLRRKKDAGVSACPGAEPEKPLPLAPAPEAEERAISGAEPEKEDSAASVPSIAPASQAEAPAEADGPTGPAPSAPAAERTAPAVDERPLILVAEDNPSNYKLVEVLLRNDYRLLHAENGKEAVELYAEHRPSVVLMDISMPVMDGYDALKAIRAEDPRARVVALTAYAFEADRQRMMQSGFDACLAKPLDVQELRRMVRSELDTARE